MPGLNEIYDIIGPEETVGNDIVVPIEIKIGRFIAANSPGNLSASMLIMDHGLRIGRVVTLERLTAETYIATIAVRDINVAFTGVGVLNVTGTLDGISLYTRFDYDVQTLKVYKMIRRVNEPKKLTAEEQEIVDKETEKLVSEWKRKRIVREPN